MKIKKDELAEFTEASAQIAILATLGLCKSACPVVELYQDIEKFAGRVVQLRKTLELPPLEDGIEALSSGELSKGISKILRQLESRREKQKKRSIGFDVPDPSETVH